MPTRIDTSAGKLLYQPSWMVLQSKKMAWWSRWSIGSTYPALSKVAEDRATNNNDKQGAAMIRTNAKCLTVMVNRNKRIMASVKARSSARRLVMLLESSCSVSCSCVILRTPGLLFLHSFTRTRFSTLLERPRRCRRLRKM